MEILIVIIWLVSGAWMLLAYDFMYLDKTWIESIVIGTIIIITAPALAITACVFTLYESWFDSEEDDDGE